MSWEWTPILAAVVTAVGIWVAYNVRARILTEVLACRTLVADPTTNDHQRLALGSRADERLIDYLWHTEHASPHRWSVCRAWAVVLLVSTWTGYAWVAPSPRGTQGGFPSLSVEVGLFALLVSVWTLRAAYRRAARKRADFEWNVKIGSRASNGDGPRRRGPTFT